MIILRSALQFEIAVQLFNQFRPAPQCNHFALSFVVLQIFFIRIVFSSSLNTRASPLPHHFKSVTADFEGGGVVP